MKKLMMAVAVAAAMLCGGCRVIKVDRSADGEYRAYYNSHWFSTEADSVTAGMSPDGTFSMSLSGVKSNPSEEFNKAMQTYTSAFVAIAQIAAAAYNPSASLAAQGADPTAVAKLVEAQSASTTAEIAAKSQRETNRIAAQAAAQAAAKPAATGTATTDCPDCAPAP